MSRFGISGSNPSENLWKATVKSADEIHTRFQANESSRKTRMANAYTSVGIAVVEKNGYTYVVEIYL